MESNGWRPESTPIHGPNTAQQAPFHVARTAWQIIDEAERIRETARREAQQLRRLASKQAAEIREAAEIETAEMRRAVTLMQAELGEYAARIANASADQARQSRPTGRHRGPPAGLYGTRPLKRPAAGRRPAAARVAVVATSALLMVAVGAGVAEMRQHGIAFLAPRATSTGETGPNSPRQDQGPGQPGAQKPTPVDEVEPSPLGTFTVHIGYGC